MHENGIFPRWMTNFDEVSDIGKKMARTIDLNDTSYTELILSIDVKSSYGKIAFNIVKGYKSKNYPDGNAVTACENLKNKYQPLSTLSTVNLDKQFRDSSLKKGQDPEVWITESEEFCISLDDMVLSIS
jgi:hypothetical protein